MVAHKPYNVNRFIEKSNPKVFPCRGGGVPDAPPRYYYHPTTDTKADGTKGSPKTFAAGGIFSATNFRFLPNFPVFITGNRKNM